MSPEQAKVGQSPQSGEIVKELDARVISNQPGIPVIADEINMGIVLDNQNSFLVLNLRNISTEGESIEGPLSLENSSVFKIVSVADCFPLAINKQCRSAARIIFLSRNLEAGMYQDTLHFGNAPNRYSVVIKATVEEAPLPPFSENLIVSDTSLNFNGDQNDSFITQNSGKALAVKISNRSNLPISNYSATISPDFSIVSDNCSNQIIKVKGSCYIRVALSGANKSGAVSGNLTFGPNVNVALQGNVETALQTAARLSNVVLVHQGVEYPATSSLDLGIRLIGTRSPVDFLLRNKGMAPVPVLSSLFASANIRVIGNSCLFLPPKSECRIRAELIANVQEAMDLSVNLGYETRIFPISFTLNDPSSFVCDMIKAQNPDNGISSMLGVTAVSGTIPNCYVETCNEVDYTKETLGATPNRCATLQRVYDVQLFNHPNYAPVQSTTQEYLWANSPFARSWLYSNLSYKLIDGVHAGGIEVPVPVPQTLDPDNLFNQFLGIGETLPGGPSTSCHLKAGGVIEPNGSCAIVVTSSAAPHPTSGVLNNWTRSFSVVKPYGLGSDNLSITFGRLLPTTLPKTAVSLVVPQIIGAAPQIQPGDLESDGAIRGSTLAVKNLSNSDISYVGPCMVKTDGTSGDPRGVIPWVSEGQVRTIKNIGNKILFQGKGCSSTGSGISYSKWALWEYDSDLPVSASNPKQISRIANDNINWPEDGAPREDMFVLDGKLYYQGVSEVGAATNALNDYRRAVLSYDPTLPIQRNQALANPNPKEIFTGYERYIGDVNLNSPYNINPGASSYPNAITHHNGKIYIFGIYLRENGGGIPEYHNGIMEYDPALPYSVGDASVLESSDNPRFIWGYTESQYAIWMFDVWPSTSFVVDNDYFIFGARMPRNPVNNPCDPVAYPTNASNPAICDNGNHIGDYNQFLAQIRDDLGQEIVFIKRSDNSITRQDLCPGCDGRPNSIKKVGSHYLFTSALSSDENNRRLYSAVPQAMGVSIQGYDTNSLGSDITPNRWNFSIKILGNKAYMPLLVANDAGTAGVGQLHVYDADLGSLSALTAKLSSQDDGQELVLLNNGVLGYRAFNSLQLLDLNQPISTNNNDRFNVNGNPRQKVTSNFHRGMLEDNDYYYEVRGGFCTTAGIVPFYVDYMSKQRDHFLTLFNNSRYDSSRCPSTNGSFRYMPEELILIKSN